MRDPCLRDRDAVDRGAKKEPVRMNWRAPVSAAAAESERREHVTGRC